MLEGYSKECTRSIDQFRMIRGSLIKSLITFFQNSFIFKRLCTVPQNVFFWPLVSVSWQAYSSFCTMYIPQSPPSHLQDYSICNIARLEFSTNPYHRMFTVSRFILRIKHSLIAQILNQRLIRALECAS
jgi:hypothetical protein